MSTPTTSFENRAAHVPQGDGGKLLWIVGEHAVDDPGFALGIVRLDPHRNVLFVNRAAQAMVGAEIRVGINLSSLLHDDFESEESLRQAMNDRFAHERGSSYRISIKRRDLGTRVRLQVSAVPEYDANGTLIGSIGFLVDESVDAAAMAIHEVIGHAQDCQTLLADMKTQLRTVVSFDSFMVVGLSQDRRHLARIYEDPPPPPELYPTMWWPMRPFIRTMMETFEPGPFDLTPFFNSPDFEQYAQDDPDVRRFRDRGFRQSLRLVVVRGGRRVAAVTLLRKGDTQFTEEEHARCNRLPIAEAVIAAMNFEQHRDLEFGFEFVRDIAAVANDSEAVAQKLVDRLAEHHRWDHVSLLRVDGEERRISLICQAGTRRFPEGYSQAASIGLIGRAYSQKRAINLGNVCLDRDYSDQIAGTCSELVMPVPGTDHRWLLNIESTLRDAFADDEQQSVETQLRIAGFILARMAALELNSAVVKSVADAVIQTNDLYVILNANPAAEKLLGQPLATLRQRNLALFIAREGDDEPGEADTDTNDAWHRSDTAASSAEPRAAVLTQAVKHEKPIPVTLKRADGESIEVLLSAASLPARVGGKVFVAADLTTQREMQRVEVLSKLFHQVASEIRVPLALSEAFLTDALQRTTGEIGQIIDKSLRQIRKAEVPLERMIRFAILHDKAALPCTTFDVKAAVDGMISELPAADAAAVRFRSRMHSTLVHAPRHELIFCAQSLLAYLIRSRAQIEQVEISLSARGSRASIAISLLDNDGDLSRENAADERGPESELALTELIVTQLMRRMRGSYTRKVRSRGFRLSFPVGE